MKTEGTRFTVSDNISKIEPYIPGKPEEELMRELGLSHVIKMASNENCLGPSPAAIEAITTTAIRVHRYPDSNGFYLKKALSQKFNISSSNIVLGNGSTELIEMIARTYLQQGNNTITGDQTFLMYRIASVTMSGDCKAVPMVNYNYDLEGILKAIDNQTRIIFLANPNNPTGTIITKASFQSFMQKVPPNILVILDEAYFEYVDSKDYFTGLEFLNSYQNLIILRTFSKIYGLAGIRLGFAIACEEIISNLQKVRSPFNTSVIAQAAARAALTDEEHVQKSKKHNDVQRKFLEENFANLKLPFVPSTTNFILLPMQDADQIYKELLLHGIIVRSMRSLHCADGLRVTVGKTEENQAFIKAIKTLWTPLF
ncbi:MAG TPA: histidinol-phosphate transaminase [Acidobacteriota bacterium]|nr:histidinol-phosphate transaminase [Acidobacteriota bacterium]